MTIAGELRITIPIEPPLSTEDYSYYVVDEILLDVSMARDWPESPVSAGLDRIEPMPGHDEVITLEEACRWMPILVRAIRTEGRDIGVGVVDWIPTGWETPAWRIEATSDRTLRSVDGSWSWAPGTDE
jgi:hypothetical protein